MKGKLCLIPKFFLCSTFLHLSAHHNMCILKWIRGKENVKMPNCWKIYPLLTFKTGTWKYNLFPCSFGARGMTLAILIENRLMWMEKCCSLKRVFCQTFNLCVRLFQNLYRSSTKQAILYDYWKDKVIMQGEGPLLPSVKGGILRAVALSIICLLLRLWIILLSPWFFSAVFYLYIWLCLPASDMKSNAA